MGGWGCLVVQGAGVAKCRYYNLGVMEGWWWAAGRIELIGNIYNLPHCSILSWLHVIFNLLHKFVPFLVQWIND